MIFNYYIGKRLIKLQHSATKVLLGVGIFFNLALLGFLDELECII